MTYIHEFGIIDKIEYHKEGSRRRKVDDSLWNIDKY